MGAVIFSSFAVDVLLPVGIVAGLGSAAWWAFANDPHWVSKDGSRFICRAHELEHGADSRTRWIDVRGTVGDEYVVVVPRSRRRRSNPTSYRVLGTPQTDSRGRLLYVLDSRESQVVLRVPPKSRLVTSLDALPAQK